MNDYNKMWDQLENRHGNSFTDWLIGRAKQPHPITQLMPSIFDVVKAGITGLEWGAGATREAFKGNVVDPAPSLYQMTNIYGLGGPAGGLTSGGMKAAPWFSAVGRTIEASPLKSAPGQQWLGTLKNTPGVKPEELDWLGVPEMLKERGQGAPAKKLPEGYTVKPVSVHDARGGEMFGEKVLYDKDGKPAVAADVSIYGNEIWIKNIVTKEGSRRQGLATNLIDDLFREFPDYSVRLSGMTDDGSAFFRNRYNIDKDGNITPKTNQITKQELLDFIRSNQVDVQEVVKDATVQATEGGTKFSQYQLPGGENYRELLLTLPRREPKKSVWTEEKSARLDDLEWRANRGATTDAEEAERQALINEELSAMRPGEAGTPADVGGMGRDSEISQDFRSGHYDEPNVLAHVRFNDRVDLQGKKTLFIEEIQSDWHQKGRKHGYKAQKGLDDTQRGLLTAERDRLGDEVAEMSFAGGRYSGGADMQNPEYVRRMDRITEINRQLGEGQGGEVPDAPFKTSWPELSLKRMIKWAADNGYDQIAWTPGRVQAERYDLSKQIKTLRVERIGGPGEPQYVIQAQQHGDRPQVNLGAHEAKDLADVVGKEMAEKIANNKGKIQVYEGLDLKVGGEGMKGFYDKMLVTAANKLGKKYGAKVGVTKVAGSKQVGESFGAPVYEGGNRSPQPVEVWSLPITEAMKKEVGEKGMPLFSGGKGGSLASILQQALTGDDETLGGLLGKALGDKSR